MSRAAPVKHPGFNRLARIYPQLEQMVYGNLLGRARAVSLDWLRNSRRILLLGEGNGRFLCELLRSHPDCEVTVVEISPAMIAAARARVEALDRSPATYGCSGNDAAFTDRVCWVQASALDAELPSLAFDAVVTHYFFDLFTPPEQGRLLANVLPALAAEGIWIDAEFISGGSTVWQRWRNAAMLTLNYRVLGLFCDFTARALADPAPLFRLHGLVPLGEQGFCGHVACRLWQKLPLSEHGYYTASEG